jgi:branched-subunit amino acid ABC-type transport system permease component
MRQMKKYLRLIVAFSVGVAILGLTMVSILFLQTWLPANGFNVSKKVFMAISLGALGAASAIGAKLCLEEAKKIEASKAN